MILIHIIRQNELGSVESSSPGLTEGHSCGCFKLLVSGGLAQLGCWDGWTSSFHMISEPLFPCGFSTGLPISVARLLAWGLRAQLIDFLKGDAHNWHRITSAVCLFKHVTGPAQIQGKGLNRVFH